MPDRLRSELNSFEESNSPFEQDLRRQPLLTCDAFVFNQQVIAASFEPVKSVVDQLDDDVAKVFPILSRKEQDQILAPQGPLTGVKGKRVAVLFSGGPAAGGNNVIVGIKKALGKDNTLLGVKAGPKGLIEGDLFEISDSRINRIINLGGFDFLGSDRTKIKSDAQFEGVKNTVKKFRLDGIVVIGGDDSNTNAAFLAEALAPIGCQVIGVPKTIDGDLQVADLLPISFGFDTATKVYSELVGNILQDTPSSRKYWHFIKLMGRSASHVALEVALQTRPTVTLISEEVQEKNRSLGYIVRYLAEAIVFRSCKGMSYGVVVIPEGLIEFIPEIRQLIVILETFVADHENAMGRLSRDQKLEYVNNHIEESFKELWGSLPKNIQAMLLLDRDSHGNLQVSQIPTERLLIDMVSAEIKRIRDSGAIDFHHEEFSLSASEKSGMSKVDFKWNAHFFGYEGRCGAPTMFDATFTYNLGLTAGSLILDGKTGFMAGLTQLDSGAKPVAIPLTSLIKKESRQGQDVFVIEKALVKLDSNAFQYFQDCRGRWVKGDLFASPGPRQMWGPMANYIPILVALNQGYSSLKFNMGVGVEQGV